MEKEYTIYPGSLHNHTDFSNFRLRDSTNKVESLIDYAIKLGHKVIAFTEHETVSNAIKIEEYYNKIKKNNPDFKVIRGNEIYLCRDGLDASNYSASDKYYHFILLAKDEIGHRQIRELSSIAWGRSYTHKNMVRVPTYYSDLKKVIGNDKGHIIGSTACFLAGQKVRTRLGDKNIEEITETDEILTKDGKWEKINFPTSRFYTGQGQILNFYKEPKPIHCTANHQFLVYNSKNKSLEWIEAKNLRKNDKCLEPLMPIYYSNNNILNLNNFKSIKDYRLKSHGKNYNHNIFRLPEKIIITNELMRLFGLWLADGHISLHEEYNKNNIGFTFSDKEFDIFYNSFVKQGLFDLGLSEKDYSIAYRPQNHRVDLNINKVEICLLFKEIFGIFHANNKYIPSRLKHINYDLDVELFFGYFLGDGYFRYRKSQGGELVAASISYQLIKDFEQLGLAIDLSGSITISKKRIDKNNTVHQESYYLTYSNAFLGKTLNKTQSFSHEELIKIFTQGAIKRGAYADIICFEGTKYRIKKVKSNKDFLINEQVYCLNTNSHNFVLNNIIVHNCLGGWLPSKILDYLSDKSPEKLKLIDNWIKTMLNFFGEGDFYFELQPSHNKEQILVNKFLLQLAKNYQIQYIITTDSHYLSKEKAKIHSAFLRSQNGEREVDAFYESTYMMDTEELESYFDYFSKEQLISAYKSIEEISNKCKNYTLIKPLKIPSLVWDIPKIGSIPDIYLQKMPWLSKFLSSDFEGDKILAKTIVDKIESDTRLQNDKIYEEVNNNLEITWNSSEVNKAHWSAYFLNLKKIIKECWNAGTIVGPGRGSGVGFLLLYLLDIIQINPLWEETKVFAWRFLNPERVSVLD